MPTPDDLIQRLTAATGNERGLFEEAASILLPMPLAGKLEELAAWSDTRLRYLTMLDAEAWTSAAKMLEGGQSLTLIRKPNGRTQAVLVGAFMGTAHTEANARTIAALKAHVSKEKQS